MTARVKFPDGVLLLPADTPYEREVLREEVLYHAYQAEKVEISLGRKSWVVQSSAQHRAGTTCGRCARQLMGPVLHAAHSEHCYCVECALP